MKKKPKPKPAKPRCWMTRDIDSVFVELWRGSKPPKKINGTYWGNDGVNLVAQIEMCNRIISGLLGVNLRKGQIAEVEVTFRLVGKPKGGK